MNLRKLLLPLLLTGFITIVNAQERESSLDSLAAKVEKLQTAINHLSKLKVSGYVQAQYQVTDTINGSAGFSGGDFKNTDNRFMIRRGRLKFAYASELSQCVLQFDITEKGVGIKDAYVALTDPWTKALTLTTGAFNRPFGYEIEFSSSSRETPERSRIFQTLFNQERDLGAKLTLQAPKSSSLHFLKLDVGLFTGNGLNVESDQYKDFMGHLSANHTSANKKSSFGGGLSYYNGGWASGTTSYYEMGDVVTTDGSADGFVAKQTQVGDKMKREYFGADGQFSIKSSLGTTTFRGEYLWGTQPGTVKTTNSPTGKWTKDAVVTYTTIVNPVTSGATSTSTTATPAYDAYLRNFSGGYVCLVQTIGKSNSSVVAKYDWYDPNTDLSGDDIALSGSNSSSADIKYNTLGLGYIYQLSSNVKITAYYEMVNNETSSHLAAASTIKTFATDQDDNVFTLRIQYKF